MEKKQGMESEPRRTDKLSKAKKIFKQISAALLIVIIVATPYLLIIDWHRFAPVVALVWMYSVIYFIFLKKKK